MNQKSILSFFGSAKNKKRTALSDTATAVNVDNAKKGPADDGASGGKRRRGGDGNDVSESPPSLKSGLRAGQGRSNPLPKANVSLPSPLTPARYSEFEQFAHSADSSVGANNSLPRSVSPVSRVQGIAVVNGDTQQIQESVSSASTPSNAREPGLGCQSSPRKHSQTSNAPGPVISGPVVAKETSRSSPSPKTPLAMSLEPSPNPKSSGVEAPESSSSESSSSSSSSESSESSDSGGGAAAKARDYLRRRQEQIQRNQQVLADMGLLGASQALSARSAASRRKPVVKRAPRPKPKSESTVVRRSYRLRTRSSSTTGETGLPLSGDNDTASTAATAEASSSSESEPEWEDSNVVRYVTESLSGDGIAPPTDVLATDTPSSLFVETSAGESESLTSRLEFVSTVPELTDNQLTKIYSMDFGFLGRDTSCPSILLAAGGHQGRCAVFGLKSLSSTAADGAASDRGNLLLSWKAHKGWLSTVNFISSCRTSGEGTSSTGGNAASSAGALLASSMLLTTSNDGTVSLWDLRRAAGLQPRCQWSSGSLHHNSGIFSAHYANGRLVTGGKDGGLVLSDLVAGAPELRVVRRLDSALTEHGVVKGVRWRLSSNDATASGVENILASCGNDRAVCLWDLRAAEARASRLEPAHGASCNSVRWAGPSLPHLLFSASFQPAIMVHDVRQPKSPLRTLTGFVPSRVSRCKRIYHPQPLDGGRRLVVASEGSSDLVVFDVESGTQVSRGALPGPCTGANEATSLAMTRDPMDPLSLSSGGSSKPISLLAASIKRKILIFRPKEELIF